MIDLKPKITFHFNVPQRMAYVCRLLRKAAYGGSKVVVTGAPEVLQTLDVALWSFSAVDFLPHCQADAHARVLAASAIVLSSSTHNVPHHQVLLNLGSLVPDSFADFERVIEVVSLDAQERQLARSRWKHYASQGCAMTQHDLALTKALI